MALIGTSIFVIILNDANIADDSNAANIYKYVGVSIQYSVFALIRRLALFGLFGLFYLICIPNINRSQGGGCLVKLTDFLKTLKDIGKWLTQNFLFSILNFLLLISNSPQLIFIFCLMPIIRCLLLLMKSQALLIASCLSLIYYLLDGKKYSKS
ncbi:MAG: hypothetical protein US95_C0001G0030 [Candidatus Woesebacteria bacterium GW2011_GWB1_38_5]|uniref:Uncharacterized protein n=3 Tax=Candidatus Woeseibacteriota TaxID=1752722 RepID=A0A0G0L9J1_9BACT|nr:MAG: hypothetical protein US67_C0003G0006 [Candidatus Woesebacteria bacterium GW2011_GWD1_38_10]KKQ75599.1 MAG: hypothetical protein US95_C0001G0030 [Candidatus Woesebacteria bacterium GW2011_GWB1_38_5]KKQ84545.1 MAG: hypothetical protein UT06_C0003G0018 [Candidatus Woesebacteria bacterium GW2011_GWA1_38_8]